MVKDLQQGYTLNEQDSIKLGRFKLRVRQIVSVPQGPGALEEDGKLSELLT